MITKRCKNCKKLFPETREYFGSTPSGGFRNSCRACMRNKSKRWAEENPEGIKVRWEKRYSLLRKNGGPISKEVKENVFFKSGGFCRYCGQYIGQIGEVEHKTPLASGGTNEIENLVWSCYQCNKEKANKTELEYLQWRRKNKLSLFEL